MSLGVGARTPIGAIAVLVAVVGGILAGERAGPGPAWAVLLGGAAGVVAAGVVRSPQLRMLLAVLAFALLGAAVMQRALARARRLAAQHRGRPACRRSRRGHAGRRPRRGAVRSPVRAGPARRRDAVLVTASGDVAGHLRLLSAGESAVLRGWFAPLEGFDERWTWKHAVGEFHAIDLVGVAPARAPLARIANRARALVLAGSEHLAPTERALLAGFLLGDTRGVPRRAHRAVPGRGPHAPHRGLGRERRVRARAVRTAAAAPRPPRAGGGCGRRARVLRHHDPVGAVGAARHRDGRRRARGRLARATDRRAAGAGARGDRAPARRSVPAAPGGLPAVVRREPRHRACSRSRSPPGCAARGGCARCSESPPPRRSVWRRCSSRCSGRCRSSRCPRTWSRSRSPRRSRSGASRPASWAASPARCRRRSRGCWSSRRSVCCTRCIAVADLAARVPVAVDGRAALGSRRPRRPPGRRRTARVGSASRCAGSGTASVTRSTTSPPARW